MGNFLSKQDARRMVVVGLTGGICSGKSTVAALFKNLGAIIIDADQVAHEVVEPDQPLFEAVASTFGREVVDADGRIDRRRLGAIVFADPEARRRLERCFIRPLSRSVNGASGRQRSRELVSALLMPRY